MRNIKLAFAVIMLSAAAARAAVPTDVQFSVVYESSAALTWTLDTPSIQSPLMVISTDSAFAVYFSSGVALLSATATTYYSLDSNATYYFKVKVDGEADYSSAISTLTLPAKPVSAVVAQVNITSVSVQWSAGSNSPGTVYTAQAAVDAGFIFNAPPVVGAAAAASFEGLGADTTYYFRVKASGFTGLQSAYNTVGSTVTLACAPSGETYALVSSTGMSIFWSPGVNPNWTAYELVVSTSYGFATVNYSSVTRSTYYEAAGLQPNTTYYFKAAAVNGSGIKSEYYVFGSTLTRAGVPGSPFLGPATDISVSASWDPGGNPAYTEYFLQVSTSADFYGANVGPSSWFALPGYTVNTLDSGRQFYFRVKARDLWGRESAYLELGTRTTLVGADITPPSLTDLQGGDNTWRGSASGYYMVHFTDFGSLLSYFQVKVSTGPNFSGTILADWSNVVTSIGVDTFNSDWQLPPDIFSLITENVTSYVSVRVYDTVGNFSVSTDTFYVLRDTTPPNVINSAVSPAAWLDTDPGAVFDVNFNDALSGLVQVLYSASNQANTANANVLGWTAIDSFASSASYTANWGVNFAGLADGASNYISARAVDAAGNSRTQSDVFRILKNTVGPALAITSPSGGYSSALTAITGVSTARNENSAVASNEIMLRELSSPSSYYYDGASFASASPVWLNATGAAAWSYNSSTVPFSTGVIYSVYGRSKDINTLLTPQPYPSAVFQFDQTAPSLSLSTPVAASSVYDFNEASGAAADAGGAGLSTAEVYVKRLADSKWWNFLTGDWGPVAVSSSVPAGASWGFTPQGGLKGALAHNQQYFVTALAKDASVPPNSSVFGAVGSTFTIVDVIPPLDATSLFASTGPGPGRIDLSWVTPGDDIGPVAIPFGQFAVQYSTFSGAVFSTQTAQIVISTSMVLPGSTHWCAIAGLWTDTTYYLSVWVSDDAGLWSGAPPPVVTLSGSSLDNMISGTVKTPGGIGVTGVLVEAISNTGAPVSTCYTLDDGNGTFTLSGIADGVYRVQATWVESGFSSSIAKDQIPMGYADVNFKLSVDCLLASVSGVIPLANRPGVKNAAASVSGGGLLQLWQGGRKIASAQADAAGRFAIKNLIPGQYTLKALSPSGEWKEFPLKLESGQNLQISPLGSLVRENSVYAYPNPAGGRVTFHVETDISPVQKHLSVFSLDGTLIKEAKDGDGGWTSGANIHEYRWNFSAGKPASGVYFYSLKLRHALSGETEKKTGKFAVVR